jgi:hypothetical protein
MARTVAEIKASIIAAKEAEASLNGLTSTSNTAIWILWVNIVALAIYTVEVLWDLKKAELEQAALDAEAGTPRWYAARVLEWQYGYSLNVIDGKLKYTIDDADARLVTKVATPVEAGVLKVKVAKGADTLAPLTSEERVSLDAYMRDIKFAGTDHVVISTSPDLIKQTGAVVYYDGKLDLAAFKLAFETALKQHLKSIYFDGFFNVNRYRDAGERVPGVVDFMVGTIQIKPTGGSFTTVTLNYNPVSGWFDYDPSFTIETVITYTPV